MSTWDRKDKFMLLQTLVLLIGLASLIFTLGRRDHQLDTLQVDVASLKGITSDLLKTQLLFATNDSRHQALIDGLSDRVSRLEK